MSPQFILTDRRRYCKATYTLHISVAEPEPKAEEPKLNCLWSWSQDYELRLRLLSIYHRLEEIVLNRNVVRKFLGFPDPYSSIIKQK